MSVVRFLLCVMACVPNGSHAMDADFLGYAKSYLVLQDNASITQSNLHSQQVELQNVFRAMFNFKMSSGQDLQLHYEVSPTLYNEAETDYASLATSSKPRYRIADLEPYINQSSNQKTQQNLDRLNMQWHLKEGDVTLGRQAITFGRARMVNPMDIFLPYELQALNTEYRIGIDAMRYQHYASDFSLFDMGVIFGEDGEPENSAGFVRHLNSVNGQDFEFLMVQFKQARLYGFGVQSSIAEFGAWFETAYLSANLALENEKNYWRTSFGIDYAFSESIYTMLELHHNGAGTKTSNQYFVNSESDAYQKYGVNFLSKNYVLSSLSFTVNPLLSFSNSLVYNIHDHSCLISVSAEASWSDHHYSQFGLNIGLGDDAYEDASGMHAGSEFGNVPSMLYISVGVYF